MLPIIRHNFSLVEQALNPIRELLTSTKYECYYSTLRVIVTWWLLLWFIEFIANYDCWFLSLSWKLFCALWYHEWFRKEVFRSKQAWILSPASKLHGVFSHREWPSIFGRQWRAATIAYVLGTFKKTMTNNSKWSFSSLVLEFWLHESLGEHY